MKKLMGTLGIIFLMVVVADRGNVLAQSPFENISQKLNQIQITLDSLVIPKLDQCCPECPNRARLPKTGQTVSYGARDDGALQLGVPWPNPRFTDNGDGTITDNLTGLIWLKNANCFGPTTWAEALNASNGLSHGGCGLADNSSAGDWRLPNIKELQSLINHNVHDPALPDTIGTSKWTESDPFTGVLCEVTNCEHGYYWSSTTVVGSGDAYYLYLGGGFVRGISKTHSGYFVWPVRDAK